MKNINLFTFNRSEARGAKSLSLQYENNRALPDSHPTVARRSPDGRPTVNRNVGAMLLRLAATLTLLLTLSMGQMWATVTIYAVGNMQDNGGTWRDEKTTLNCHNWGSSGTTWPGQSMTKWNDVSVDGHQVWKCNLKADANTNIIFNNGSWQTADKTINATQKAYPYPTYLNGTWYYSPRVCKALWESDQHAYGGRIYFDNSSASWGDTYMYFVIGHESYVGYYRITNIGNTKLYYVDLGSQSWGDSKYVAVVGNSSSKTTGSGNPNNLAALTHFSDAYQYSLEYQSTYLVSMSSGTNCSQISMDYKSGGYSDFNSTQTINTVVKAAGGSYTSANSKATISITSYALTGNGTATKQTTSITTSAKQATVSAARTATTTLSVGTVATGYQFDGWYTAATGGTQLSSSTTYTYYPTAATTVYARFSEKTYTVSFANDGHGTTSPSSNQTVGQITGIAINATPSSGYSFNTWTITSGSGSFTSSATTASNTFKPTANSTITASFNEDLTYYTITYGAGSNGSVAEDHSYASGSSKLSGTNISITATPATHYKLEGWYSNSGLTTLIAGAGTSNPYSFALSANTAVYAKFVIKQCAITLDRNGGSAGSTSVTATHGSTLPSFTAHTRTGYTLKGYYTETSGGTKIINADGSLVASTTYANASKQWNNDATALTLHAQWDIITYTISYELDGGTNYASAPTSYKVTTSTITLGTPTKTHYHFDGWTNAGGSAVTQITKGSTGNITLTAHWTKLPMVYLKNTMNWANAYVTFYKSSYWDASNGAGSSQASGAYVADPAAMTYNSSTGLFEYECPDVYAYTYACFTKDKQDNYGNFYETEAIYCNNNLQYETVAIVAHETNETKNSTKYYTTNSNGNIEFVALVSGEGTGWFFPGGWSSWETKNNEGLWNSTNIRWTKSLSANTSYEFKVYNHGVYYGNSGTYSATGSKTFTSGGSNCTLSTTLAGTYTFDYNTSTNSLTISYPAVYAISGDFNSWTEETNLAFSGNDGSYSVSITGSGTNYEFKVLDNGSWYGHSDKTFTATESNVTLSSPNNNIKLKADVYPSGTYTFAYNKSTHKLGVTYPTNYAVTFGKRTGGSTVTAKINNTTSFSSGTKIASGTSVTFSQTAADGYTFEGWYNAATGGTKVSSSSSYTTTISAASTVYANYTPNQYTVSFNKNGGGGDTPGNITVTYDAPYGTLPAGPTPPGADQFVGWFTAQTGGTQVTSSTIVSTASGHTLWARFEHTYTVTVQYKCGSDVLRAQTTTQASESSVAATIIAPVVLGYEFANWSGDNATFADASNDTTTVHVTTATTVVANYNKVPMVYFKNNLDWDSVFVSFDCGWADVGGKQVPTNNSKPYYKMTQLGSSDIFYCRIPSTYTDNNYAGWKGNIAFDNKGAFGNYTTTHTGNSNSFYQNEFLGRGDFDPNATMFIPYNGASETRNSGKYYTRGCWIQYNSNYSGYKVRVNTYVQGSGGSEVANVQLTSSVAGATEFTAKVNLSSANYTYGVMLYKDYTKNSSDLWYTNVNNEANTITSSTTSLPWPWEPCNDSWQRCRVKTEALGDYIFTVSFATGIPMVDIEYPVTVGDFRLVYKDRATWNTTHNASWYQVSNVFKKEGNRVDTASFFVSFGSSPTVELQKCTAIDGGTGAQTWTKQGDNISLSSIDSVDVYNFTVTQNDNGSGATGAYLGKYDGKFYIRTDASDGGWNNYQSTENALTYSEYSMSHGGSEGAYSHYYMRHVNNGQNIKFVIANDYSICLTDTLVSDTLANEWIEREANVRFSWNCETNKIARSYISGSSIVSDRFLVLEGDANLFDASGNPLNISGLNPNEMNFIDDQNWVYEATVKANPRARIKLTAKFGNKVQYFYGTAGARSEETTYQLIGGTTGGPYKIRVVYDFKTNRLVCAWMPDDNSVDSEFKVEADVMILRYHQGEAQQITFSGSGKLTDVKTVYGTMQFNKYRLNNQDESDQHTLGISKYERDLFFISFPFDVKLNDVFGFGQYGKHWIIEYYDGKTRAQNGYWKDSPTNWKFVTKAMKDSYTLKANEGYVLALDLDELTLSSSVWNYGVENVYLYFPSEVSVKNIQATSAQVKIDTVGYQCTINRNTPHGDRRVKDSHWHLIGVPSYANASHSTSSSWSTDTDLEQTIYYPNIDPAAWTTAAPFVYVWNCSTNKFGVVSAASTTFKPMQAYLTQYARDTLNWAQVNTTKAIAARRNANYKSVYEFRLSLQQDGVEADRTFVSMRDEEDVTTAFDFNYDLCKEIDGSFTPASNIYTMIGEDIPAAGNCLPLETEQQTTVPVGVVAKTTGEYTFAMPDGTEGLSVTLVDNFTGAHTNLALGDYTVELEAGTYEERFTLVIDPRTTTTAVETIGGEGNEAAARKVFINGLMYIQRGSNLYDAQGRKVN